MWSLTHFDDIINKMEGLLEPTVQTSTGGSCMAIRLSGRKVLFSGLKFLNMTPLNHTKERFSNMTVLNSHKERTAPPPRHLKRGGHRPPHFKNCSAGPVVANVRSVEKRSNQPKYKGSKTRSPKTTAKLIQNNEYFFFHNNISAGRASLLQVYRCYWTYVGITILFRWVLNQLCSSLWTSRFCHPVKAIMINYSVTLPYGHFTFSWPRQNGHKFSYKISTLMRSPVR